jgi:hypothetical protein
MPRTSPATATRAKMRAVGAGLAGRSAGICRVCLLASPSPGLRAVGSCSCWRNRSPRISFGNRALPRETGTRPFSLCDLPLLLGSKGCFEVSVTCPVGLLRRGERRSEVIVLAIVVIPVFWPLR